MKKKVLKNKIRLNMGIIFFLMFIVCFGIMGFYYLLFNNSNDLKFENKIETESYIDVEYPLFKNGNLDKGVDQVVSSQKDILLKGKYDLLKVKYSHSNYKHLYSFHFISKFYRNEAVELRNDNVRYIDSEKKEIIDLDKIVSKDDEYYSKIKYVVNAYLEKKELTPDKEIDYDNLIFSEDKIYLVAQANDKEVMIPIEYVELKKFLNKDYFNIKGEYKAPPVIEKQEEQKEEPKEEEQPKEETSKEETKKQEETKKEETKKEETKKTETNKSSTNKTTTDKKTTTTQKEELKSNNDGSGEKIKPVVRDEAYFKGKKLICFTFDDGPARKNTTKLLDALKARNFKATFFMVGNRVKSNKDLVLRMKNEGHSIGQHSWSHQNLKKLSNTDPNRAKNEIYLANDAIKSIIGENPRYIRPPYGAYNSTVLLYANMVFVNWSIDPLDWKYRNANKVYNSIISKAYDGAIVLVHDIHPTSVDGAIKAMDYLAKHGYAIVSLDEMVKLRGINLETHKLYTSFKKK